MLAKICQRFSPFGNTGGTATQYDADPFTAKAFDQRRHLTFNLLHGRQQQAVVATIMLLQVRRNLRQIINYPPKHGRAVRQPPVLKPQAAGIACKELSGYHFDTAAQRVDKAQIGQKEAAFHLPESCCDKLFYCYWPSSVLIVIFNPGAGKVMESASLE